MTRDDMAIGRDYMLKKPDGPSAPKVFFDTQFVPLVVNAASVCEVMLDHTARRTGVRSAVILAGLVGAASLLVFATARQAGRRPNLDHV